MKKKLIISIVVLAVLLFSLNTVTASQFKDIEGHWAKVQIEGWVSKGLAGGYQDGTFRPNNPVTRAEFAAFVNRAFSTSAVGDVVVFSDVTGTAWYYADVASAVSAGIMSGYPDNTFRPGSPITRQEAASVLTRLLSLTTGEGGIVFADAQTIASWAKNAVNAVSIAGIMGGYPDGTFRPLNPITRAETVVILDRGLTLIKEAPKVGTVFDQPGTYGPEKGIDTIKGSVIISSDGVTLQNVLITGDLIISEKVGDGDVTLNNVTVKGKTYIRGGGPNSIYINGGEYGNIIVEKSDGGVRIVVVGADGIRIVIAEAAEGIEVILEGTFASVTVEAPDITLIIQGADSKVDTLNLNAPCSIKGKGSITTANINADGVKIEQTPQTTNLGEGITAIVGGETVTAAPPPPSGGWVSGPTPLTVTSFAAGNLNVSSAGTNIWTVSGAAVGPIGTVTITFSQNIDKNNFDIRAYQGNTLLVFSDKNDVKARLQARFSGGGANQLSGNLNSLYEIIWIAMQASVKSGTVDKLEFDIFKSGSTEKVTLTVNITAP